jgi:DNA-binding CsgD family transcriptional regulator
MLAARTGLSPVMVGRAAELARLRELAATHGEPAVVLVTGEAGIGKTRLVAELVAGLGPDVPVLAGQGSQGAPGRPFQLLLEAVEPVVEPWEAIPEPLAGRAEPLRLLLGPVAPRLAASPERDYGQEELLRAAVALVRELVGGLAPRPADGRPARALLVFEDLQWADAQSVALFGRLAVAADLPLLLVGTFRPEGVARRHPVVDLLAELDRQRSVTSIALERLDRTGVAELLAAVYRHPVPFRAAEALHQRTGGNPFFLEELVVTAGRADPGRLAELPLPWNLTEAVLRRLDDLTPDQRRVVDAAAILGRRIPFDLLAAVTGSGEEELIAVLRHLVAENVVVEEEPDVFAFRHALTREAIASRLLGRERRRLHEKALAALQEAGGDDHAAIAWHARGAGRYDEMVEAARQGAWSYLQQGATAEALRLAEQGLSEADRDLDLLAAASKAAWLIGLNGVAVEHGERWHAEAEAGGQPVEQANALIHLARCYWEACDQQRHWRAVWAALAAAERLGDSRPLARAYDLVAQAHMLAGREAEAVAWADRAIALAERLDCPDVRAGALVEKGSALIDTREGHEQGVALLEQAIAEAEAGGFGFTLHRALNNLLVHQVAAWPPARTRQVIHQMQATAERTGQSSEAAGWALGESAVAVLEGDLQAALAAVREARRSAVEGVNDRWWRDFHEAPLLLEAGALDELAELLARQEAGPHRQEEPAELVFASILRLALAARRGDLKEARAALAGATAPPAWAGGWSWKHEELVLPALLAALRAGMAPAEVRAHVPGTAAADSAGTDPDRWSPMEVGLEHLQAALLEAEGEAAAAADAYLRTLRSPCHRPAYLVADCRAGAARCLLAVGDQDGALRHAREAGRLLERWPGWRRDEAHTLLRRLGDGGSAGRGPGGLKGGPLEGQGPAALTPREREVAALLAEGLSNGEVARRLFISTKTASVHVSNILAKLGMASRAEVAAWAVRVGLAEADPAS